MNENMNVTPDAFDPMTGQPVNAQPMGFDPMTGQPVNAQPMGFDPMTGQPVNAQPMGFDPMTGQPVNAQPTGFDPMTGQPVYGNPAPTVVTPKSGKGLNVGAIIAASVAGVALIGGIIAYAVMSSPKVVVPKAIMKTAVDCGDFAKAAAPTVLMNDSYTADMTFSYEDGYWDESYSADMSLRVNGKDKQFYGDFDMDEVDFDVLAEINSKELKVAFPSILDDVVVYNYVDKKSGDLEDMAGTDFEDIDKAISGMYNASYSGSKELRADLANMMTEFYVDLDFEKVDKDTFEVDGKDRSCKGYQAKITSKNIEKLVKDYKEIYMKYYGDSIGELDIEDEIDDMFDEILDEVDDFPTMKATFYIYKGELAAVILKAEGETVEIDFEGGDYRLQNIVVKAGKEEVLVLEGSKKGSTESGTIEVEDEGTIEWEYDTKSGEFEITFEDDYGYNDFTMEGTLKSSASSYVLEIEEFEVDDDDTFSFSLNISKGAKFEKFDGDEFDIGNADEDEIEDFAEDFMDEFGY